MFEFDKYDASGHAAAAAPTTHYTPFAGGRRRSFLLWGEHCIECAAPDCFSSCDLYDPRPDRRCRRFQFGVFKNKAFPSAAGYGAEVVFRRWGKLEARGNATLLPAGTVRFLETALGHAAPILDRAGALADRMLKDIRLSYATHSALERLNSWLHRRGDRHDLPDAFVVEIYNPGPADAVILLSMAVDRTRLEKAVTPDRLPRPLLERIVIPPGHFRRDIPRASFRHLLESRLPFGIAVTPDASEGLHLVFLTLDFVAFEEPQAIPATSTSPPAKCVVFDLDNTVWDGILLEGKVQLREGVLETIRQLDERGILCSVASKNAHDDAIAQLRAFGIEEYLLYPAIGWAPKSESIRQIAKQLNIGLDSILFIDDNMFERDEVVDAVPGVEVLPDSAIGRLVDHPRLQGKVTQESRQRRLMYQQSMAREQASVSFGSDYTEFLRACEIAVTIRPDEPEDSDRIAELVQRTNQLNFSGRKYSRPELEQILSDDRVERYVVSCSDRYGSYGIVGFCMARRSEAGLRIDDLMLSCRVQGKYIEKALLHHLCSPPDFASEFVEINFVPTDRNAAARAVLADLGFPLDGDGPLRRTVSPGEFSPDFITVTGRYPDLLCAAR